MIMCAFISVYSSRKQGKFNKASVLTKLPHSLVLLRRGPIAVWLRDGDGGDGGEADWVMLVMT